MATSMDGRDSDFADASNVDQCCKYINQSLASYGFPSPLAIASPDPVDAAAICNCLYVLLQQRQRDIDFRDSVLEQKQRMASDISRLEKSLSRMQGQLESKERELTTLQLKEQKTAGLCKAQLEKLQAERDELQKANIANQQRQAQLGHEIRKKEVQYVKLQEKLNQLLVEKKKETKAGMEIMNLLQKEGRQRGTWNGTKRSDSDFYKMIVESYEQKKVELLRENQDLRAALLSLQTDMRALLNSQPASLQRSASGASFGPPETPLKGRTDVFDMPYAMSKGPIEESLRMKLHALKDTMDNLQLQAADSDGVEANERELDLEAQLLEARTVIQEQEAIIQRSLLGGGTPGHAARRSAKVQQEVRREILEEEKAVLEQRVQDMEQEREAYRALAAQLREERSGLSEQNDDGDGKVTDEAGFRSQNLAPNLDNVWHSETPDLGSSMDAEVVEHKTP